MANSFATLVDSDAFIGWFVPTDAHHAAMKAVFERFARENIMPATTNVVVIETATWLSRFADHELGCRFLAFIRQADLPIINVDDALQREAEDLYAAQPIKNISLVDCCNVTVVRHFSIPSILSFDSFYFKRMGLTSAA